jgi:hypothetical protein
MRLLREVGDDETTSTSLPRLIVMGMNARGAAFERSITAERHDLAVRIGNF